MNICNELRVFLFLQARVISSFHFSFFFFLFAPGQRCPGVFFYLCLKKALMGGDGRLVLLDLSSKTAKKYGQISLTVLSYLIGN